MNGMNLYPRDAKKTVNENLVKVVKNTSHDTWDSKTISGSHLKYCWVIFMKSIKPPKGHLTRHRTNWLPILHCVPGYVGLDKEDFFQAAYWPGLYSFYLEHLAMISEPDNYLSKSQN